ncbi:MAG: 50S ribosomal protein L30 [bacterium]
MSEKEIKVTLKKSLIGRSEKQRKNAAALGMSKTNQTVVHKDTPVIRGMINKVSHLVTVE